MDILVFGAGENGRIYKDYVTRYEKDNRIIGFLENGKRDSVILDDKGAIIPVYSPDEIRNINFDLVVVSNSRKKHIEEIKAQLIELNVDVNKTIILCENEKLKAKVLASYNRYDEQDARVRWIKNFSSYAKQTCMEGNVAECGVYKGELAYFINKYFADRMLYLFDTFEGFSEKDLEIERKLNNEEFLSGQFNSQEGFQSGGEEVVIERMEFKDRCIIKKGYFPETAKNVEDRFCFVNLDMDLYQPTLEGLRFFYNRTCKGGVILIHDYFHPELPGIKQAVEYFEKEREELLIKIPIGDFCSIAIIKR